MTQFRIKPGRMTMSLLAGAAMLAGAAPANAGVPVIDPTAIARIREEIAVATQTLATVKQQVQQVQGLQNSIGQMGASVLSDQLAKAGVNFNDLNGATSVLRDVVALAADAKQMQNTLQNYKIDGESIALQVVSDLVSGRANAKKIFFYNGGNDMNQNSINGLRKRRSAAVRESAINGYALATAMKGNMEQTQKSADAISEQAKKATDLRGDVQANTAALLAIYAETTKQTALMAQALEVDASSSLASDPTGKAE